VKYVHFLTGICEGAEVGAFACSHGRWAGMSVWCGVVWCDVM
jgi:hypothetical protein